MLSVSIPTINHSVMSSPDILLRLQMPCPKFDPTFTFSAHDDYVIDSFSPRAYELSPPSSAGSDLSSGSTLDSFIITRSRVIRFFNLPPFPSSYLAAIFHSPSQNRIPLPATMWVHREDDEEETVWAVFKSHSEASKALSLFSASPINVLPALESDLEPFYKLRKFDLRIPISSTSPTISLPPPRPHSLRMSSSVSDLQKLSRNDPRFEPRHNDFTISTNPPNPRTSFRLGDWICGSPSCAAHNFGRNTACIGCSAPRPGNGPPSSHIQSVYPNTQTSRLSSPRFTSSSFGSSSPTPSVQDSPVVPQAPLANPKLPPTHPIVTPSGRAFASGGKVQNVSSDPLSPCIMFWPDNEPFPEQTQIRPSGTLAVPQPPILNTGNRGPIEHQPGDWICHKCNYLNWRRRKVCQTCYPYAEGNGDSISAAVQTARISLLTSTLQSASISGSPHLRPHSSTSPQQQNSNLFVDISHRIPPVHRSQSNFDLGAQYTTSQPIYQTSGQPYRQSSLPFSTTPGTSVEAPHTPAPLLPSFLHEIMQSPSLSPTSTSSADVSLEEYEEGLPLPMRRANESDASLVTPLENIWRMDGEETKKMSAVALPNHRDLMGGSRKSSREVLRLGALP